MLGPECGLDDLRWVSLKRAEVYGDGSTHEASARAVNGIGTGVLNAIVPVWATETAEHTSRGQFIAIEFTLNIFGVVVAYWLEL